MARPYASNPLSYVVSRQIDVKVDYRKKLVNARFETSENLFRKDLLAHYGCVNAIEFSSQGDLLLSGGDDKRVLLWKVEQAIEGVGKPAVMKTQHISNIFCLGYDSSRTKIFSAGNDEQVIVHDLRTAAVMNHVLHEKAVYGLSIHPQNDNVFASACEDGRVLMFDIRDSNASAFCLAQYKAAFHSVMFNPVEPRMLATGNAKDGVSMWDARKPLKPVFRYDNNDNPTQSCMCVRFNSSGTRLLALRRRLPPILYAVHSPEALCRFYHSGYYNSCTMKSCCFAGVNDEYVLSGSDDFNLYMWKIPEEGVNWVDAAHMVLRGHRSIVNQVRYNPANCVFASSGVEKIIKIWSPFTLGNGCRGGLKRGAGVQERQRRVFSHGEYIGLVLSSGQFMTHDYSHQSTREDPRMMAFFDSLVQREIEGWNTSTDSENNPTTARTFSATDSDDSITYNPQRLLSMLETAVSSRGSLGSGTRERSLQARNRITRLMIGYRRRKFIRLITMNSVSPNSSTSNSSVTTREPSASGSSSKGETTQTKCRSKSQTKSKAVKRKHPKVSGKRNRVRRKCTVLKINSDSDSDELLDTTLPSTSSGVISSTRSRYSVNSLQNDAKHSSYSSSSSSSTSSSESSSTSSSDSSSSSAEEDNEAIGKRKYSKIEPESCTKTHRRKNRKCKNSTRRDTRKSKTKRQKIENEDSEEDDKTGWKVHVNGNSVAKPEDVGPSTPHTKSCKVPSTPDSGITSAVSTVEKNGEQVQNEQQDGASSDHEQKLRNLECFRKKVDVARRSYRNRSTPLSRAVATTTDSSD